MPAIRKPWFTPVPEPHREPNARVGLEPDLATDLELGGNRELTAQARAELAADVAPFPHDLRWTASHLQPEYRPVESWLEIDLLLMQLGEPDLPYVVVESPTTARFAQAMGESDAMIIEVCSESGMPRPAVWRLRRSVPLPYAELAVHSWEGDGVAAETLFMAEEASIVFRSWLGEGALPPAVTVERVVY